MPPGTIAPTPWRGWVHRVEQDRPGHPAPKPGHSGPSATKTLVPSLTPRAALEKLGPMQMVDVQVPTTDGRVLILPGCTQPDTDQKLLLSQLTNYVAAWTRETRHPSTRKLAFFSFAR